MGNTQLEAGGMVRRPAYPKDELGSDAHGYRSDPGAARAEPSPREGVYESDHPPPMRRRPPPPAGRAQSDAEAAYRRPPPPGHRQSGRGPLPVPKNETEEAPEAASAPPPSGESRPRASSSSAQAFELAHADAPADWADSIGWLDRKAGDLNRNTSDGAFLALMSDVLAALVREYESYKDVCDDRDGLMAGAYTSPAMRGMVEELEAAGSHQDQPTAALAMAQCQFSIANTFVGLVMSSPCASPDEWQESVITPLPLVQSLYDGFWVGCTGRAVKLNRLDLVDSYPHPISAAMSPACRAYIPSSPHTPRTRWRMDAAEYATCAITLAAQNELSSILRPLNLNRRVCFVLAVPDRFTNRRAKVAYDMKDEVAHIMRAIVLDAMKAPIEEVQRFGIRMTPVNKRFADGFGKDMDTVLEALSLLNVAALLPIVHRSALMMADTTRAWLCGPSRSIRQTVIGDDAIAVSVARRHRPGTRVSRAMTTENKIGPTACASGLGDAPIFVETSVATAARGFMGLAVFSISPGSIAERYMQTARGGRPPSMNTICAAADIGDAAGYAQVMGHLLYAMDLYERRKDLTQLFVARGLLESAYDPVERRAKLTIGTAIRATPIAFVSTNARFVPTFDITLAMISSDSKVRCVRYSVDFYAFACHIGFGAFTFVNDGRTMRISFPLTADSIVRALLHMPTGAAGGDRLPMPSEEAIIPTHWRGAGVNRFASEVISSHFGDKGGNGVLTLENLRVYSMTPSESSPNVCALVSTARIKSIPASVVPRSINGRTNHTGRETRIGSKLDGFRLVLCAPIAGKMDSGSLKPHDRAALLRHIVDARGQADGENIIRVASCAPCAADVCVKDIYTYTHQSTGVQCAARLTIALDVHMDRAPHVLEDWAALYGFWPTTSMRAIDALQPPLPPVVLRQPQPRTAP